METLQVTKENAVKAFNEAETTGKELLVNLFGREVFYKDVMDIIKTVEDACKYNGTTVVKIIPYENPSTDEEKRLNAYSKLLQVYKAINTHGGFVPDYTNSTQYKYYPYFKYQAGVGFAYCGYLFTHANSYVGSRLCTYSSEIAMYIGKRFAKEYNELFL